MQILSALEAISPALARTKLFLYSPFRWGRTWKLSATAYLSFVGTIFMPITLLYGFAAFAVDTLPARVKMWIIVASLALTVLYVVAYWLCSRLKFAFFDMLLNNEPQVAPAWRKYGRPAAQWSLVKMAVGTVFTTAVAVPAFAAIKYMIRNASSLTAAMDAHGTTPGFPPEMANFMMAFYGAYFLAVAIALAYVLLISTASSFVVPTMALENAPVRVALGRFWSFVRREMGQFVLFVAVRVGLAFVGYMASAFVYEIVLLLIFLVVGAVCGLIGLLLHLIGVPLVLLTVVGVVIAVFCVTVVNFYLLVLTLGPFFTFFEAHTLYFLGGRYPLLGELLERSTPPPPSLPPYPYQNFGVAQYVSPAGQ